MKLDGKKTLFILFLLFLIVTFLREEGILNLNYYRTNTKSEISSGWTSSSAVFEDSTLRKPPRLYTTFSNLSILVIHQEDLGKTHPIKDPDITIFVKEVETGFLWTPMYKSTKFHAEAIGVFFGAINKTKGIEHFNMSETLNIKGEISIIGFCSHREAINIIKEIVEREFTKKTNENLSSFNQTIQPF